MAMNRQLVATSIVATVALMSCSNGSSEGPDGTSPSNRPFAVNNSSESADVFTRFGACDELLEWTKTEMLKRITPYGLNMYPVYYASDGRWTEDVMADTMAPSPAAPADESMSTAGGADFTSNTNTQEEFVDEGDISETDGRYVYTVFDNTLRMVDLDTTTLIDSFALPRGESQIVLTPDRLYVVTSQWDAVATTVLNTYTVGGGILEWSRTDYLEGQLLSLRVVKGVVQVTMHDQFIDRINFVSPVDGSEKSSEVALERNEQVIGELTTDDLLPRRFEDRGSGARGESMTALDCEKVGGPDEFSGWGITWIATIDLTQPIAAPTGSLGIVSESSVVYTSNDSIYTTTTRWNDQVSGEYRPNRPPPPFTAIHKFAVDDSGGGITYVASGRVDGTLINSYSMSEFEGRLRVASTTNVSDFGGGLDNGVHVFEVNGDRLEEVGAITGLGRGELIQAVRFDGSRAYVVTFRQIDPFFVLDLSEPTRPMLTGELKIPGYSTYLKPIDGDRVIGVGMEGTEGGSITGAQVSVFDVSDPANPVQTSTARIGDWSSATSDPHAFLWWSPTGTIVVPKDMTCPVVKGCDSAVVLRLDGNTLTEQGGLFQWFPIQRTLVAKGRIVTLSAAGVSMHDLDSLAETGFVDYEI